jgi:DNA-directed RNA polymerase
MKLEADAIRDGLLRYAQSCEYQLATDSKPIRELLYHSLKPLGDAILAEQIELKTAQRQKLPKYGVPLLSIGHEELALITLGTLFNAITRSECSEGSAPGCTSVAYEIGQRCRIERIFDCVRGRQVDVARELLSRNRSGHAWRRAEELAQKLDDEDDWAKNYRSFHLGEKLISLAVRFAEFEGAPMFELSACRESDGRTRTTVALSTPAGDWIAGHEAALASLSSPVHRPMIVPARPWSSLSEGGYLATPLTLLKRKPSRRAQRLLDKADLSPVFSAVNAMQNTAYRINKAIDRDMRDLWDAGHPVFGLETHTLRQLPPRLPDDADPNDIHERKRERADAVNLNQRIKGTRKIMGLRFSVAELMIDEPHIYFPHQLDHRGRAYPVPQMINPQCDDIGRSPLEFAEGKPLGERGAYWLAIHMANCYGKNKVSFDERLSWVHQHEQEIIAFADKPLRVHRFWQEADKPWLFRAACKEWKGYREQGPDFRSHLPVSMDGTCNGYQHLSAMARDLIGGRATNLIPGAKPEDIYQEVADHVRRRLRGDAENNPSSEARGRAERKRDSAQPQEKAEASKADQDAALQLLFGKIDRSVVKHATMTTPYGVTRVTIYSQLLETDLIKSCRDRQKCARYLARVLEESIAQVAVEAGNIMTWLRSAAHALAKANRGVAWTTPAGFRVVHEIREPRAVRVTTWDRTLTVYQQDEKRKIDWRKQVDGIVAHFVHSMDASHMMMTINRLTAEGLRHFAMVHDSFGVHASDVDTLNRVLREEFVRIYSEPVLQKFLDEQRQANPGVDLPDVPQMGNLDIRQVIASLYFFA